MEGDLIRGSLDSIQSVAGLLIALAVSVAGLWVVVARPQWVDQHQFKQARSLATLAVAVGLVLVFVFWGNAESLPQLGKVAFFGIPICLAAFMVNVGIQVGVDRKKNLTAVLVYLVSLIAYVAAGSISLSASAVMLMVWGKSQSPVEQTASADAPVQVTVQVRAMKSVERAGEPVPFQVTSGQLNWRCDQRVSAEARFKLPPGAIVGEEPKAEWHAVNGREMTASVERLADEVIARGQLSGLPAIPFEVPFAGRVEHCPGGGNGELRLAGSYTPTRQTDTPFETVLSGQLRDSALSLDLPSSGDLQLVEATVAFSSNNTSIPGSGRLVVPLTPDQPADKGNERFRVRRVDTRLEISRR